MAVVNRFTINPVSNWASTSLVYTGPSSPVQGSYQATRTSTSTDTVQYSPYSLSGWRQRLTKNVDATTILLGTRVKLDKPGYYSGYKLSVSTPTYRWYWSYSGHPFATVSFIPTTAPATRPLAGALAAERFIADYYEKTRSIRGSSSLAEAASTVRGLASPARALRKEVGNLYDSLRKRLRRTSGDSLRDMAHVISGTWLEWSFGIKPLVQDVNAAADAVNAMQEGDFRIHIPLRGVGVDKAIFSRQLNQGVSASYGPLANPGTIGLVDITFYDETISIIRGGIVVPKPDGITPAMRWGLTTEDVLPAVWEAIPFSFFIDYFVNVSSVIDAWSMLSSRLSWVNRTVRNSRIHEISQFRQPENAGTTLNGVIHSIRGGHAIASCTSVLRSQAGKNDFTPPMRVKLPLPGTKWANIAALAAMLVKPSELARFR